MKIALFVLFTSLVHPYSLASRGPDPDVQREFTQSFFTHYQEGRCRGNILDFIKRSTSKGIDLSNGHILFIRNKGTSLFGLINVEYARRSKLQASDYNWQYHVVFEHDGFLYDFDFGNAPTVLSVKEYFEKMFLRDEKGGYGHYVGREEKLKSYEISEKSSLNDAQSAPMKYSLREYLEKF